MRFGIMQPYFFPNFGHFELINNSQKWVIFDTAQYTAKTWMNRNRIMHPSHSWQYITAKVNKLPLSTQVRDITLVDKEATAREVIGQLTHYKKRAPNYRLVIDMVRAVFADTPSNSLVQLNSNSLNAVCRVLDINFEPILASSIISNIEPCEHSGQWALNITNYFSGSEYINPMGGKHLFRPEEFDSKGIKLLYQPSATTALVSGREDVKNESLSIIDTLMWNEPEFIKQQFSTAVVEA